MNLRLRKVEAKRQGELGVNVRKKTGFSSAAKSITAVRPTQNYDNRFYEEKLSERESNCY